MCLTTTPVRRVAIGFLAANVALAAAARGTPAEAKAMLQKAIAHYTAVGRKQALADFTAKKTPYSDRDLYVVCVGAGGIVTAHGAYPAYVGASADVLKDADNKPVGTTIWNTGSNQGLGSLQYPMINPLTHKVERKNTFFQKVGDDVCAVGAYEVP